jgi:sec-independent protein translocase protein TatB
VVPGFQEIVVIVLIAVLVVGPNRLPTVTRDVTKFLLRARGEVRTMLNDLKGDMDSTAMGDDLRELKRELDETRRMASQAMRGEPEPKPGPPGRHSRTRPETAPPRRRGDRRRRRRCPDSQPRHGRRCLDQRDTGERPEHERGRSAWPARRGLVHRRPGRRRTTRHDGRVSQRASLTLS